MNAAFPSLCLLFFGYSTLFAAAPTVVDSGAMHLEFQDGWLTKWTNKTTGETVNFGPAATEGPKAWVYQPGAWWHPAERPEPANRNAEWTLKAEASAPDTAIVTESLMVRGGIAQAVQWSMNIPLDQLQGVYVPWGLAPARMITKDYHTKNFSEPSYYFEKRTGILSFHEWRERWYILQGKTGGLIIYCDDPNFESRQALEYDLSKSGSMTLTNRDMACAPWKENYQSARWVIRQYQGWMNAGAQIYQDYIANAYKLVPLADRPTAWVTDLAFCLNKPAALRPPNFAGPGGVGLNYNSDWTKSLESSREWLTQLAKVIDPGKVMFYVTGWRQAGNDNNFPSNDIDPYFFYACRMARSMGFHVMLHFHSHLVQDETIFYTRYIRDQSRLLGIPLAEKSSEDSPYGLGVDALRDAEMVQRDKEYGSPYFSRMGLDRIMTGYQIHPGWEAYRYMKVANIVSAVKATGADMIHLDVPAIWHDKHDDRFKENVAQGMHELLKLLRKTFDEEGLAHVAIATEVSPSEPIMPYVDMAQMARASTVQSLVQGNASENLVELQVGKDLDVAQAGRAKGTGPDAKRHTKKGFDPDSQRLFDPAHFKKVLAGMPELGEPSIMAMATAPYVLGYPHLGNFDPDAGGTPGDPNFAFAQNALQGLQMWWSLANNTLPNTQTTIFSDQAMNEGRVGLGRFWAANRPRLAKPMDWQQGELARYQLKDGTFLWVTRIDPLTLRFHLTGGKVLAEMNIFEGWKNDAILRQYEVPDLLSVGKASPSARLLEATQNQLEKERAGGQ